MRQTMKAWLLIPFAFILMDHASISAQVDYSKPEAVAERFLELYFTGDWYKACTDCSTPDCDTQLSYMIKVMETDDNYVDEGKCTFAVDSCKINKDGITAICFYTKTCSALQKSKKSNLHLKKIGEKWLVDYIWRRDKFL